MNYFRTAVLLAAMTALFMSVGFFIGGEMGMIIAFGVALVINLWSFWNSDKAVLSMHGAREVGPKDAPEYYNIVRQLAENADLPMPRTYVMYSDQPNAFATGRNPDNAAVCATTGLLDILSQEEVAGVMAHELAHIKNRDTLIMTITATFAGAISMLANFGLLFSGRNNNSPFGWVGTIAVMLIAPLAAAIVQMAISRAREYEADKLGAEICQRPIWLASALERISGVAADTPIMTAERNPATAHMFIYNPLSGERLDNLFSTHPDVHNRIQRLDALAKEWGQLDDQTSSLAESGPWSKDTQPKGPWS